jgi:cellulose biosynthesis protein BcsS
MRRLLLLALLALGVSLSTSARAGTVEGLGGWEGDSRSQGYGFAGLGILIPQGKNTVLPLRFTASYLYYQYDSTGASIRVRSPGLEGRGGIRWTGSKGSASALAGVEVRHERRQTLIAGEPERKETIWGMVAQLDGDYALARRWRGFAFVNYGGASQYVYGRGAIRYQASNLDWRGPVSVFLGAEAVRQGNDESDAFQAGGFFEFNFVRERVSLGLRAGRKESWSPGMSHVNGGYFGLSLYRRF